MNYLVPHSWCDLYFKTICLLIISSPFISTLVLSDSKLELKKELHTINNDESTANKLSHVTADSKLEQDLNTPSSMKYSIENQTKSSINITQADVTNVSPSVDNAQDIDVTEDKNSTQNTGLDANNSKSARRIYKCRMDNEFNSKVFIKSAQSFTDYIQTGKTSDTNETLVKEETLPIGLTKVESRHIDSSSKSTGNLGDINSFDTIKHYQIDNGTNGTYSKNENQEVDKDLSENHQKENGDNDLEGKCVLVLFYYDWCPFSVAAAQHYHAIARLYPNITVLALDAYGLNGLTMRYNIMGVPTILFFFDERPIERFNETQITVEKLANFVHQLTLIKPDGDIELTEQDSYGPLPTKLVTRIDHLLVLACLFNIGLAMYFVLRSQIFSALLEYPRNIIRRTLTASHSRPHEHHD